MNYKGEFLNFELIWIGNKIIHPWNMDDIMFNYKKWLKKYLIFPICIDNNIYNNIGHANILFYNLNDNSMERFEPYGSNWDFTKNLYDANILDDHLYKLFITFLPNLKYYPPKWYLP